MSKRSAAAAAVPDVTDVPSPSTPPVPYFEGAVAIGLIDRDPYQPRRNFERGDNAGLLASVRDKGILQPLLLRLSVAPDRYLLVCGERRFRAAQAAGLATVPGRVFEMNDHDAHEIALIENIQRQDLHALEEAETFARLQQLDKAYTDEALAAKVGKSVRYVQRRKKLLSLPADVREAFLADVLTDAHAEQIASLPDALKAEAFADGCFLGLIGHEEKHAALKTRDWAQLREDVASAAGLRNWIDYRVKRDVDELQDRLPGLADAVIAAKAAGHGLVEVSRHYQLAPAERKKFPGLLSRDEYREISRFGIGTCDRAERAVLVHAGRPALFMICRIGNGCPIHEPKPAESARHARPATGKKPNVRTPTPAEAREKKRRAQEQAYEAVKAAALRAMTPLVAKATVTPAIVKTLLAPYELTDISKAFGLTPSPTNGAAILLAHHVIGHCQGDRSDFAAIGKLLGFDLGRFEREEQKRKAAKTPAPKGKAAKPAKKAKAGK